jgi:hypothetical protein
VDLPVPVPIGYAIPHWPLVQPTKANFNGQFVLILPSVADHQSLDAFNSSNLDCPRHFSMRVENPNLSGIGLGSSDREDFRSGMTCPSHQEVYAPRPRGAKLIRRGDL